MNVLAAGERVAKAWILREMRQKAQLDLRVIGADEGHSLVCNKRATNGRTNLSANRDVLQVRLAR